MAYKFQQDAAQLSGSVTINAGNNLLFQLDGRSNVGAVGKEAGTIFTEALTASVDIIGTTRISGSSVYANNFYGNGSNITGLSSDTLDIETTVGSGSQPILNVPSTGNGKYVTGSTLFGWDNGESHLLLGATSGKTPSLTLGSGHDQDALIVFDASSIDWCMGYDATAHNFEIGTSNALGSQPVFTIAADGTGAFTFTGSAPSLTIGGGDAVDTKVVFDGNAADFYLGLDDTDDKLHIGLGSAVGTTANLVLNSADRDVTVGGDLKITGEGVQDAAGAERISLADAMVLKDSTAAAVITLHATSLLTTLAGDLTVSGNDIDCAAGDANLFATAGANTISIGGTTSVTYQKGGTQYQYSASTGDTLTLDESHSYMVFNSSPAVTASLPSGVGTGTVYRIKRANTMASDVTITGSGKIDGEDTIALQTAGAAVNVIYDGMDWHIY